MGEPEHTEDLPALSHPEEGTSGKQRIGDVFKQPSFGAFFTARTFSFMGTSMTTVALTFTVLQKTNDARFLGYVLAAHMIPMVAFLILGGGLADRFRRDRILQLSNVSAGVTQAGIAMVALSGANIGYMIPLAVLNGVAEAASLPALRGIVPDLVQKSQLQQTNSLLGSVRNVIRLLGPVLAGFLAATVGGGWATAATAVLFFGSAFAMFFVKMPTHPTSPSVNIFREIHQGFRYFISLTWVWQVTLTFALVNAIYVGGWQILGPVISEHSIGASGWGIVLSFGAAGVLLGSLILTKVRVKRPLVAGLLSATLLGLPLIALGIGQGLIVLVIGAFVAGLGSAIFGILWDTTLQSQIPKSMISRVTSFDDFGAYVTIPIGQLLAVPIGLAFGYTSVVLAGGLLLVLLALLPLRLSSVRTITIAK